MLDDPRLQLELSLRLVAAAGFGALIGLEREVNYQQAGIRTHLLVALGSAVFTLLSIYGFSGLGGGFASVDPSRIAAQVVSGVGFLGAGAILRQGLSIRGLTTAASLWATAALGMAAGAGQYILAVVGTALVLLSLWPLGRLVHRVRGRRAHLMDLRLEVAGLGAVGAVTTRLVASRVEMTNIETRKLGKGRYELAMTVRLLPPMRPQMVINALSQLPDVDVVEAGA